MSEAQIEELTEIEEDGRDKLLDKHVVLKSVEMSKRIARHVIKVAQEALEANEVNDNIANHVKNKFDRKYGGIWQCFVGTDVKFDVTHLFKSYINISIYQLENLLFKTNSKVGKHVFSERGI